MSDIKTEAIVLKRVNYNEGDRIVAFLTPDGRISGIAKGARREKSKLAGGIEMFCLSKIVVHQRDTKNVETESEQFGVLTSAKAIEFYQNIISALELASNFLKQISRITHHISSAELFSLTRQTLYYLNQFYLDQNRHQLIAIYFKLNLAKISGEEINVFYDSNNQKLESTATYDWDDFEKVFVRRPDQSGSIDQNVIKILRLILSTNLGVVLKIKNLTPFLPMLSHIAA